MSASPPGGRGLLALQVALFVALLGLPDGALGVLWPSLRAEFARPVGDLGLLTLAGTGLYVAGSLLTGPGGRRLGPGGFVAGAAASGVAGYALWLLAPGWAAVVAALAAVGFARGAVDGAANAAAALAGRPGALGLIHASYGVGATAGPLLAAPLLAAGGWRPVVAALALAAAAASAAALALRARWPATPAPPTCPADPAAAASRARLLRTRLAAAGPAALLFTYVAVEAGAGFWAYTLLTEGRGLAAGAAGPLTAAYWAALTGGRALLAPALARSSPGALLYAALALAAAGLALLALDPAGLGAVGLPLAGLGLAPIFPLVILRIPRALGPARAPDAIGWAVGAGAVGGPAGVWLAGQLANRAGLEALPPALTAGVAALALLALAVHGPRDPTPAAG